MEHQEKDLMAEQKPRIEKYLNYNYNNIESVTLTETYTNPTGVTHIKGYINNNKKLKIDAPLDGINGVEVVDTTTYIYENYMKQKYKFKSTNVSDIEAEEKAKKKKEKESNTEESSLKTRSVQEIMTDLQSLEASILQNNQHPL
ncbi:DUF1433 domain-containing protein [Listeria ivanovii]|uniref:DUF1433 domain-containing protein n=1 Tax=Listeria ivanovii TaxID=1638 RepID=UPI0019423245|nr:DUF1433 domain-containing protein [Listeria ivanovii]MBM5607811.1 DUF1433 domain-containing protein [Listeria ivanovii]MBM5636174.1 DUF1433 domain-containing protein [Listeria ivanovii]MBM5705357.1 DUF1433 domain-containing protein [Listeria ivanovii]